MLKQIVKNNFLLRRVRKNLLVGFSNRAGCNFFGRKTIYTQSGGLPFKLRVIDYKRNYVGFLRVLTIEKDLNRTGLVGLVCANNGMFSYILLTAGIKDMFNFFANYSSKMQIGAVSFLYFVSTGSFLHNIEIKPMLGAAYCRAAGTAGFLISKDENNEFSFLKMKSGWLLKISNFCLAVNGIVSNELHKFVRIEKAGKRRLLGFRPHVRGVVKNPCDHPHGGGEGKGSPPSVHKNPLGKPTKTPTNRKKWHYIRRKNFKIF